MSVMRYIDLEVYKKSFSFALRIHRATLKFPEFEQTELARQLRRSSKSIVGNLVEGTSRFTLSGKEQRRFLILAVGSKDESKLWLAMSYELGYLSPDQYKDLLGQCEEIGKMLYGLWRKHRTRIGSQNVRVKPTGNSCP